ncbi:MULTISPECIES: hypothetical protein [Vibrio]|uniref:hypothetical protein n=1 Tax=Vibrio TaxID=662 RepID=UPI000B5D02AD|nr:MULTISPECIES: hypothetical protein [Vibrio]HBV76403.1 hypothetical protein [Vibrio sp.]
MTNTAYDTKQIPFPIQDRINNRVDTSDPTNKAIIEKNKVLKKINAKYGMMVDYLIRVIESEEEKTGERMKAISTLMSLQEKILKEFGTEDQKTKQVLEGEKVKTPEQPEEAPQQSLTLAQLLERDGK